MPLEYDNDSNDERLTAARLLAEMTGRSEEEFEADSYDIPDFEQQSFDSTE